jgi:hypothetical protein
MTLICSIGLGWIVVLCMVLVLLFLCQDVYQYEQDHGMSLGWDATSVGSSIYLAGSRMLVAFPM